MPAGKDAGRIRFNEAARVALLHYTAPISMWGAFRGDMAQILFEKFSSGLDRRKTRDSAGADALYELTNAQVTGGHELSKRACAASYATLEPGSRGLFSALGVLNTFATDLTVAHGSPAFEARFVPHPTDSSRTIAQIHYCEAFRGYLYVVVEYDNGDTYHHYLDAGSTSSTPKFASPAWAATTAYATTSPHFVTPTTPNGFRYQCTTGGTSGGTEPTWPTTIGGTVVDGTVTWTCRSFVIVDANCPHSQSVVKVQNRIFAVNGEVVRFCALANARDWTTASDAGFLPTGSHQDDSSDALAVAKFKKNLAVFFADAVQVWFIDPDPDLMILQDVVPNTGTRFPRSPGQVSQDTLFLSDNGFRSLQLSANTDQMQDTDIGAPIDELVKPLITDVLEPFSTWFSPAGQFWCVFDSTVWAFTFSRTSKVNAWSKHSFPWTIDDATVLNGRLYLREGDNVYRMDEAVHADAGMAPRVVIEFPFLDFKAPGVLKLIQGCDFVGEGSATISFKYRATDINGNPTEGQTGEVTLVNNSMPGVMTPVELCVVSIAPRITHQANEAFRMAKLAFYYELLSAG
jgi:hypothetical protein